MLRTYRQFQLKLPASKRKSGSILIMLVVGLFVFLAAYGLIAAGQVVHARRLGAEYGHLQATYAAESAIYAALVAKTDVPVTNLWSTGASVVSYTAKMAHPAPPTWTTGDGSATLGGDTFTARVRGYSIGTRIILWDFGP